MIIAPIGQQYAPSANFSRDYAFSGSQPIAAMPIYGPLAVTLPVSDEPQTAISGTKPWSYFDEFYHRIHVKPDAIALNNVITNVQRSVEVWNAHFASKTLTAITPQGTVSGISLSGHPSPPLAFGALQSRVYTLTALVAGDPVIDGRFVFDFGTEEPTLRLTGRRIVIWSLRPQWAQGITERLEWATDVMTAHDGGEQRVRLRSHARRSLEAEYFAAGHEARIAETLVFGWGGRKYCLPVWMERDVLAAPVASGAVSLTVTDAALKDYRAGGYAVLWASPSLAEAIEISSISGNTINLKTPVAASYPAGASVCPGIIARIDGQLPVRRATDQSFETRARFIDEQGYDRQAAEIGPTWQGYAVLDERPDRIEDVTEEWERSLAVLDAITGMVLVEDTANQPVIRRSYSWLLSGRAAIDRWKKWAAARAGRYAALWLPTFADDLTVTSTIAETATAINVKNAMIARYAGAHPLRAAIRIETASGNVYHRRITSAAELDEATESLTIDQSLGVTLQPADIRRVMWVWLARLESDAVEIHYETDRIARLSATFRMVTS